MKGKRGDLYSDEIGPLSPPGKALRPNRRDVDERAGKLKYARPMQFVQSFADDKGSGASASFVAASPKSRAKGRDTADAPLPVTIKP